MNGYITIILTSYFFNVQEVGRINFTLQVKRPRGREVKSCSGSHQESVAESRFELTLKFCSFFSTPLEVYSQALDDPQPLKSDAQWCITLCASLMGHLYFLSDSLRW